MATAGDIITASFLKIGIGVPTTAQTSSALISLNNMINFLGVEMVPPYVTSESFALVASDSEYTIGSGGQWDTVRPVKVLRCFLRDDSNYDYPVSVMGSLDRAIMSNKAYSARPSQLYYLSEYPLAKIIFNTLPDAAYDAYFEFWKSFTEFAATTTAVDLPPEYREALVYNLAVSLGEDWDRIVSKTVFAQAMRTREVIDRLNAAARTVPKARFDFDGLGSSNPDYGSSYISVTDEIIDGGAF